jgi:hypothetical protein
MAQSVTEIISQHVTLSVEEIDRMYHNVFVPGLQYEQGIVRFFREHHRQPLPSAALMSPMTPGFVAALENFAGRPGVTLPGALTYQLRRLRLRRLLIDQLPS